MDAVGALRFASELAPAQPALGAVGLDAAPATTALSGLCKETGDLVKPAQAQLRTAVSLPLSDLY